MSKPPTTAVPPAPGAVPATHDLALVPAAPAKISPAEQQHYLQTLIAAAHNMHKTGWGDDGTITSNVEEVRLARVWINPYTPVTDDEEALRQFGTQLKIDGQKEPILVYKMLNPFDRRAAWGERGDLCVRHGRRRRAAATYAQPEMQTLQVIVAPPPDNFYELMIDVAGLKFAHVELPEVEKDEWIGLVYEALIAETERHPEMPRPTQTEIAARLGISQGRLSRALARRAIPQEIKALHQLGLLPFATLDDLLPVVRQDPMFALEVATGIATQTAAGVSVTRDTARDQIRLARETGRPPRPSGPLVLSVDDERDREARAQMWIREVNDLTADVHFARLAHDLTVRVASMIGEGAIPEIKALLTALRAEPIQQYIREHAGEVIDAD
jgi:hypothetical protein